MVQTETFVMPDLNLEFRLTCVFSQEGTGKEKMYTASFPWLDIVSNGETQAQALNTLRTITEQKLRNVHSQGKLDELLTLAWVDKGRGSLLS